MNFSEPRTNKARGLAAAALCACMAASMPTAALADAAKPNAAAEAVAAQEAPAPGVDALASELEASSETRGEVALGEEGEAMALATPAEEPAMSALAAAAGGCGSWKRLAGENALGTMRAVVGEGFANCSSGAVVVATMDGYWDALTASGIAGIKGAPVLLTDGASLSAETRAEIARLGAKTAYVAGGTAAVSSAVADQIKAAGCSSVVRLAGANAIGTANEIYKGGQGSWGGTCVVATSSTFQDALSIAPFAYAHRAPIFLADDGGLSAETLALVKGAGFERAVIAGGIAAVPASVEGQLASCGIAGGAVVRLWGATCYETSAAIAEWEISQGMSAEGMAVATGEGYWDALGGAALCGKKNSVLVLASDANRACIRDVYRPRASAVSSAYVLGGAAAVSNATWDYAREGLAHSWKEDTRKAIIEISYCPQCGLEETGGELVENPDYESGSTEIGKANKYKYANDSEKAKCMAANRVIINHLFYTNHQGGTCLKEALKDVPTGSYACSVCGERK